MAFIKVPMFIRGSPVPRITPHLVIQQLNCQIQTSLPQRYRLHFSSRITRNKTQAGVESMYKFRWYSLPRGLLAPTPPHPGSMPTAAAPCICNNPSGHAWKLCRAYAWLQPRCNDVNPNEADKNTPWWESRSLRGLLQRK